MSSNYQIRKMIQKLSKSVDEKRPEFVRVKSVDVTNMTCVVSPLESFSSDLEYHDVMINFNIIPVVGETVIINWLDAHNAYIAVCQGNRKAKEVDKTYDENGVIVDWKVTLQTLLKSFEEYKNAIDTYSSDIQTAIQNATWNTPSGPTVPIPLNIVEFQSAKSKLDSAGTDFQSVIDSTGEDIKNKYVEDED